MIVSRLSSRSTPASRSPRRDSQNLAGALERPIEQVAHGDVDLASSQLGGLNVVAGRHRKERLRCRRISALADCRVHAVTGHHFQRDLSGALEVVGGAAGHVAVEHQLLGGTAAHQDGDAVF